MNSSYYNADLKIVGAMVSVIIRILKEAKITDDNDFSQYFLEEIKALTDAYQNSQQKQEEIYYDSILKNSEPKGNA